MLYAALFGAFSSLLTAGYITLYNQGVKFFGQPNLFLFNINFWPLVLLSVAGVFIGLAIKFFGQHGGLGVAQRQYAQTGRLNFRNLPSILLQGFISLWSGAAVGPEGPLVFLTGSVGTFVSEKLKLQKDDVQVLVLQCHCRRIWWLLWLTSHRCSGCIRVHVHQGTRFQSPPDPRTHCSCCWLWSLLCNTAYILSRHLQLSRLCVSSFG